MARTRIWEIVHCDLDPEGMQCVKVMTLPWAMGNNGVKYLDPTKQ